MRIALLFVLVACGDNTGVAVPEPRPLTAGSPYPAGCAGASGGGSVYAGFEVEPMLAIDPHDAAHLVAAWQQDRWSNGIATATTTDGGATWVASSPPFSRCAGGAYDRASDPWIAIDAAGTAHAVAIAFDATGARSVVLASSSADGGATWGAPAVLIADDDADVFDDKESISADADHLYVVWDRVTGVLQPTQPIGTGPALLARRTAGTWEPARAIYDPGVDAQTIGNVIAVLPDGTLVDVFDVITSAATTMDTSVAAIRSTDHGETWSAPVVIATVPMTLVSKVHPVRDGEGLPAVAVDATTGAVYVAWESELAPGRLGIAVASSLDGGLAWSAPVAVNGAPLASAFTPAIAVTSDGTVAVSYYDNRDDRASDDAFLVSPWLARSTDGGATWSEARLAAPFDLRPALIAEKYYFLGDYQGLVARDADVVPLFAKAVDAGDPTDIFVGP